MHNRTQNPTPTAVRQPDSRKREIALIKDHTEPQRKSTRKTKEDSPSAAVPISNGTRTQQSSKRRRLRVRDRRRPRVVRAVLHCQHPEIPLNRTKQTTLFDGRNPAVLMPTD